MSGGSLQKSVTQSATGSVSLQADPVHGVPQLTAAGPGPTQQQPHHDFLERLLARLTNSRMRRDNRNEPTAEMEVHCTPEEVFRLTQLAAESFARQPSLLHINSSLPLTICADIHGQFRDVRLIMERQGQVGKRCYLFLGDYADRGVQGVEVLVFLLANKVLFPEHCFMLRGNHEDYNTSMVYGLLDECLEKYGDFFGQRVWLSLVNVFNHMPFAALVDRRILCMHGGLSPEMRTLDDIDKIQRPCLVPLYGIACDLVWADPSNAHEGWALSPRGISFTFDETVADRFCEANGVELIVRGHQISNDMHRTGYQFSPGGRVLTLFTASDYLRAANTGATLDMILSFTLYRPVDRKRLRKMNQRRKSHDVSGVNI